MEVSGKAGRVSLLWSVTVSFVVWLSYFFGGVSTCSARLVCEVDEATPAVRIEPRGSYVVAISETVHAQFAWRQVAQALREKYGAELIVFPAGRPQDALPELRCLFPAQVCFVVPPEECGRAFVVAVHRLTRQLDDDPYGDVLWGIIAGYEAEDALRMARLREPLVTRNGATSMGPGLLDRLDCGFASSEARVSDFWTKEDGQAAVVHTVADPDVFYTSGHATEHDWQIAYNIPGGSFRCDNGRLFAQGTEGGRTPIVSPNTKVYLPVGNCLIGHIDRRDCMTTAWLHSGGIGQVIGYTAVTFYGYMGWGTGCCSRTGGCRWLSRSSSTIRRCYTSSRRAFLPC